MGVLAAQMRLVYLVSTKNDLEFKMMGITEKMSTLSAQIADSEEYYATLDPEDKNAKALEAKKARLNQYEKQLQRQQMTLQTRLQQVMQEIQACQQMLGANIQSGLFSYGMGMGR